MLRASFPSIERLASWQPRQPRTEAALWHEECRAWVRHISDLRTTCRPSADEDGDRLAVRVRDVSRVGIRLLVARKLRPGMLLKVELPGLAVLAWVVHVTAQPEGEWGVGCTFAGELSNEELGAFGVKRLRASPGDYRAWLRSSCSANASYSLVHAAQPRPRSAEVANLSPRGIGLLVSRPVRVGAILDLTLHDRHSGSLLNLLPYVIHVTLRPAGKWLLGCSFIRELTDAEFQVVVPERMPERNGSEDA